MYNLLTNVHVGAKLSFASKSESNTKLVSGNYEYYHYLCDGTDDRGWGCGYRTLQTICSWMRINISNEVQVPSIREIQELLVKIQDKEQSFIGSREWIGSFEVCLVLEELYEIPSKILHVNKGDDLKTITKSLVDHFESMGSPVMMGGDVDCSSKGIMGIHVGDDETFLLVVDPHYAGKEITAEFLQTKQWVKWQALNDFIGSSFYNLCLPQVKAKQN